MYKKAADTVVLLKITNTIFAREVDTMSVIPNKYMTVFIPYRPLMHNISKLNPFLSTHKRKQVNTWISFFNFSL